MATKATTAPASNNNIKAIAEALQTHATNVENIIRNVSSFTSLVKSFTPLDKDDKSKLTSVTDATKSYLDVITKLASVDAKKLKSLGNISKVTKTIGKANDLIQKLCEAMGKIKLPDTSTLENFVKVLIGDERTITNTKNKIAVDKDGKQDAVASKVTSETIKSGGILSAVELMFNVYKQIGDSKHNNIIKRFKMKTNVDQCIDMFSYVWSRLGTVFGSMDPSVANSTYFSIKTAEKVLTIMPNIIGEISSPLIKIGALGGLVNSGIDVLLGTGKITPAETLGEVVTGDKNSSDKGIVRATLTSAYYLSLIVRDKDAQKAFGNNSIFKIFAETLDVLIESVVTLGFFSRLARKGIQLLVGTNRKGGLIQDIIFVMKKLSKNATKEVVLASVTIKNLSKAFLLLSLSIAVIALTGILIVTALPLITVTLAFLVGLLWLFSVLGSKLVKREIKEGAQTILLISLTITLMAMTAVLIVTLAQFIQAEWESLAIIGVALAGLLVIFAVLSSKLVVKEIEGGAKSILKIALCIALMALIAVGLVWVSDYVHGDWESLLQIGFMMLVLTGTLFLISLIANKIDASDMVKLTICTLLLCVAVGALALIGQQFDLTNTLATAGIMAGIAIVIGGILVGLSFIPKKLIKQGEIALGIVVACAAGLAATVWILADAINKAGDMKKIWEGAGIMGAIVGVLTALVIGLGALTLTGIGAVGLAAGTAVLGGITLIAMGLSNCIKEIAVTAAIMKTYNLDKKALENTMKMPIEVIKDIMSTTLKDVKITTVMAAALKFKPLASISEGIGTMANVLRDIALLNIPTKVDEKGNPIEWRQMNATDFENAGLNAAVCASVLTKIFTGGGEVEVGDGNGGKKTIFVAGVNMDEVENISFRSMIKFKCITDLSTGIGNVAQVIKDIASFSIPAEFNADGTPKSYKKIDPNTDLVAVGSNVALMVETIVKVFGKQEVKDAIKGIDTGFLGFGGDTKAIEAVFNAVGHLSGITTLLACIARGEMPYEQYTETDKEGNTVTKWRYTPITQLTGGSVDTNIKNMITTVIKGFALNEDQEKQLDAAEDNIDDINKVVETGSKCITTLANAYTNNLSKIDTNAMNSTLNSLLTNNGPMENIISIFDSYSGSNASSNAFEKQTKSAISLLKQVNDTDLSKLQTTTSMFAEIRKFSQSIRGDFEELAECINEEIITAIEKLEETLTKIKDEGFNVNVSGGSPQQPTVNDMKPTGDKATQATIKNLQDKIKILENGTNAALRKLGSCIDNGRMKVNTES